MTTLSPDISVIVPAYNAADKLERCVNSILCQKNVSLELIIVDDKSSDNTLKIAYGLQLKDARVQVVEKTKNGGPGAARNTALDVAKGKWIAVVDADDRILEGRLSAMLFIAESKQVDVVFDNLIYIPKGKVEGDLYIPFTSKIFGYLSLQQYISSHLPSSQTPILGFLKPFVRRNLLIENNVRYDPNLRIGEDSLLIFSLYAKGARVYLMDQAYYEYKRYVGSISYVFDSKIAADYQDALANFILINKSLLSLQENEILNTFYIYAGNRLTAKRLASGLTPKNFAVTVKNATQDPEVFRIFLHEMKIKCRSNLKKIFIGVFRGIYK